MSDNVEDVLSRNELKTNKQPTDVPVTRLRPMLTRFSELLGEYVNEDQRWRLGKVLTVVDASIADLEQRKAIKDLINGFWWNSGSRYATPDSPEMENPHVDLNAICEALGFELYPPIEGQYPVSESDYGHRLRYRATAYDKVAAAATAVATANDK